MPLQIVSLEEKHLEDAAELVTMRYHSLRSRLPALPARCEQPQAILELLRDLPVEAGGVAAVRGNRLVGFLTGMALPEFMGQRSVYSPDWANGVAPDQSRRITEEMYTRLSDRWVADGCYAHFVSVMAHDRQDVEAWNWLGFGLVNVDGVRPLTSIRAGSAGVEVRQATAQDARELCELGRALERHVAVAPTFWLHELEDFGERLNNPGNMAWLAHEAGKTVGFIALEPGEECDCALLRDEKTTHISGAFTVEAARGRGVAAALLDQALTWARAQGYARCAVDFESANSLATRFWMRWFEPVSFSLERRIDERVRGE